MAEREWLLEVRFGVYATRVLSFRSYQYMALIALGEVSGIKRYAIPMPGAWEPVECRS